MSGCPPGGHVRHSLAAVCPSAPGCMTQPPPRFSLTTPVPDVPVPAIHHFRVIPAPGGWFCQIRVLLPRYRPRCQVQQTVDAPRSRFGSGGGPASVPARRSGSRQYSITWRLLSKSVHKLIKPGPAGFDSFCRERRTSKNSRKT